MGDKASGQASGAYIFRPKSNSSCVPVETAGGASIELSVSGGVVSEVRQRFAPWLTQTVRLAATARHAGTSAVPRTLVARCFCSLDLT